MRVWQRHPSARWMMNCNHFQPVVLAYNLNCWLMLFNREEDTKVEALQMDGQLVLGVLRIEVHRRSPPEDCRLPRAVVSAINRGIDACHMSKLVSEIADAGRLILGGRFLYMVDDDNFCRSLRRIQSQPD
jgi:hypothetical protein